MRSTQSSTNAFVALLLVLLDHVLLVRAIPVHGRDADNRMSRQVIISVVVAIVIAMTALVAIYLFCKLSSLRQPQANRPVYIEFIPRPVSQRDEQPITIPKPAQALLHSKLNAPTVGRGYK